MKRPKDQAAELALLDVEDVDEDDDVEEGEDDDVEPDPDDASEDDDELALSLFAAGLAEPPPELLELEEERLSFR